MDHRSHAQDMGKIAYGPYDRVLIQLFQRGRYIGQENRKYHQHIVFRGSWSWRESTGSVEERGGVALTSVLMGFLCIVGGDAGPGVNGGRNPGHCGHVKAGL